MSAVKKKSTIKFDEFRSISEEAIRAGYLPIGLLDRIPTAVHVDRKRGWVVQVWTGLAATPACIGTPWEGTARISVTHTKARDPKQFESKKFDIPIEWDELQEIKEWLFPGRIAVEVYPPESKVINVANMRWLWVLPLGAMLPFNLQATQQRLES